MRVYDCDVQLVVDEKFKDKAEEDQKCKRIGVGFIQVLPLGSSNITFLQNQTSFFPGVVNNYGTYGLIIIMLNNRQVLFVPVSDSCRYPGS